MFALVTIYEIIEEIAHFKKIRKTSTQENIKTNQISEKMLFLKFGVNEYVTIPPNNYEKT